MQPENLLLARLPPRERTRLLRLSERVGFNMSDVLAQPDGVSPFVYFPTDGFISVITLMDGKPVLEVGMVGTEGMLGAYWALGSIPPDSLHPIVQGGGHAWRMSAATFQRELARSPALRQTVYSYLQVTFSQLATSAACIRFHKIEPRLARWLLMTQDRAHSDTFEMTHEFLAFMLGMRRVGITTAAAALQRRGFIRYRRGVLTVLSRRGLLSSTCSCYGADRKTYSRVMS
jgi:CRP-like cAMP-binding protein